ncbi:hypothetical protein [Nitratifractor sp.]
MRLSKPFGRRGAHFLSLLGLLLVLTACGRDDTYVKIYDRNLTKTPPKCLRLDPLTTDPAVAEILKKLYPFTPQCPYRLSVTTKERIRCNSNANAAEKTLSNFPSAFVRLELYRGTQLLYSYYRDLTHEADADDLERAFKRFEKDCALRH